MTRAVFRNYGLATVATASVSGAHFLLQLSVLHQLGAAAFGLVAFVMVLIQFGTGLCNALVAAPFTVAAAQDELATAGVSGFYFANMANALGIALLTCIAVLAFSDAGLAVACGFGFASGLSAIRWFGRTVAYTQGRTVLAALSDGIYSLLLLGSLAALFLFASSLFAVVVAFIFASLAATLPFGLDFFKDHLRLEFRSSVRAYGPVWRSQAKWALAGLVTTEATANSHSYIVTAVAGPAGFAPLAAAALFMRPVGVCLVSLTQLERPALARAMSAGHMDAILPIVRRFTLVLVAIALATALLAAGIMHFAPSLVFKPGLDPHDVMIATAIWSAIMLVLCIQTPLSVVLQAGGQFRELAFASIRACGVTICMVLLLLFAFGSVYSALGVLAGQLVMTADIILRLRPVLKPTAAAEPPRVTS